MQLFYDFEDVVRTIFQLVMLEIYFNNKWESNIKRCPLFFNRICTIDPRWTLSEVE